MIQIYVKGTLDTRYKLYDNGTDVVIHLGATDFWCHASNLFHVLLISWWRLNHRFATSQEILTKEDVSGSSNTNTNGLFDFNSYLTVDQTMPTCTEVICEATNPAIVHLDQQAEWRRSVTIKVPGNLKKFTNSFTLV